MSEYKNIHNIMNIGQKVSLIREYFCEGNNLKFAERMEASPTTTSNWCKAESLGKDVLVKILSKFPEVDANWLLMDLGEMLRQVNNNSSIETKPRIPYTAAAGSITNAVEGISESQCEHVPVVPTFPSYDFTIIVKGDSISETTLYEGSAPVTGQFAANVANLGSYTPYYEWRFYENGDRENPFLVRYDPEMEYTFDESGSFNIELVISFVDGLDTLEYSMDEPFTVSISTSKLEIPNAFSPNGDGQNDVFKVKEGYQSIVSFHGYIFNRWGKKIYEWTDIDGGWDGDGAKDGVYFVIIKARGADGRNYNLRRDVNLLRGYESEDTSGS